MPFRILAGPELLPAGFLSFSLKQDQGPPSLCAFGAGYLLGTLFSQKAKESLHSPPLQRQMFVQLTSICSDLVFSCEIGILRNRRGVGLDRVGAMSPKLSFGAICPHFGQGFGQKTVLTQIQFWRGANRYFLGAAFVVLGFSAISAKTASSFVFQNNPQSTRY